MIFMRSHLGTTNCKLGFCDVALHVAKALQHHPSERRLQSNAAYVSLVAWSQPGGSGPAQTAAQARMDSDRRHTADAKTGCEQRQAAPAAMR